MGTPLVELWLRNVWKQLLHPLHEFPLQFQLILGQVTGADQLVDIHVPVQDTVFDLWCWKQFVQLVRFRSELNLDLCGLRIHVLR